MDLFSLVATLGVDTSGFSSGITGALNGALSKIWEFEKDIVKTGAQTQKQLSAVQAVLGAQEGTAENMEKLYSNALDVAKNSIFTVEETADAYYYMGMAGWKTEQMLAGLPGVINLAAASGEDLAKVSDIVTDSLTAFGLGAGQSAHFADVLAQAATNSNTDVSRMGQTFKYVAPVAGALGYSIEDVATSIGILANAGIKGSTAGTSLRNIFTRIATNAGATEKSMGALEIITQELGVSFYDAAGSARPWGEFMTDVRAAWRQLDPGKVQELAALFGELSIEGLDASEILADFTGSLDDMLTEWNSLTTDAERNSFVNKYGAMFEALGINMRDSNGNLREFNQIAKEARTKLGGLNDEESVFYANKIGNLRGMAAWLALVNATDEDYQSLAVSIGEADGAARRMADMRLDNLWGDKARFESIFDVIKNRLFDLQNGPLREVMGAAVEGLNNVDKALEEGGWEAALDQLSLELDNLITVIEPKIAELAKKLVPAVSRMLGVLWDNISPAIEKIVLPAMTGLVEGLINSVGEGVGAIVAANPSLQKILSYLGVDYKELWPDLDTSRPHAGTNSNPLKWMNPYTWLNPSTYGVDIVGVTTQSFDTIFDTIFHAKADAQELLDGDPIVCEFSLEANNLETEETARNAYKQLQDAIAYAEEKDATTIQVNTSVGVENISLDRAHEVFENLKQGMIDKFGEGSVEGLDGLYLASQNTAEQISTNLSQQLVVAGEEGGSSIANSLNLNGIQAALGIGSMLISAFTSAGSDGGSSMANGLQTSVNAQTGMIEGTLATSLGDAGYDAGNSIVSHIQSALSWARFAVNVVGTLTTLFGGGVERHGKSQHTGHILHGATVFGMNAQGEALVGGENGPEAIVGTNELSNLITNAVNKGTGGDTININIYQQPGEDEIALANRIEKVLARQQRQRRAATA